MTLKSAVIVEDFDTILHCIDEKGINYEDSDCKSLLQYACEYGSVKV